MFKKFQRGFTLIELLIVIAVLGVLAVAVLSAINPIEQINRGKDTGSRSDAEQMIGAIDRYYTAQGIYPWQADKTALTAIAALQPITDAWIQNAGAVAGGVVLEQLDGRAVAGTEGEVKQAFTTRINDSVSYNTMNVYMHGATGDSYYVCYAAKSSSFKTEANKRCSATGSTLGDVTGAGLPADLRPIAGSICIVASPMVCLP